MPDAVRFPFSVDPVAALVSRLFGVTERTRYLEVGGEQLTARFGPWQVSTPLDNVADVEITGPYRWWRVVGPARFGLSDRSLTFASTTRQGVELTFHEPVPGLVPLDVIRHPTLTVTVADPEACISELVTASGRISGVEEEPPAHGHDQETAKAGDDDHERRL